MTRQKYAQNKSLRCFIYKSSSANENSRKTKRNLRILSIYIHL